MPLAIGLGGALALLSEKAWRRAQVVGLGGAAVWAYLSWAQCAVWHDGLSFWSQAERSVRPSTLIYSNLGRAYYDRQRLSESVQALRKALAISQDSASAHLNLGTLYLNSELASREECLKHLERALELRPNDPLTLTNLGTAYLKAGQVERARERYLQATALEPQSLAYWAVQARMNLGISSLAARDGHGARAQFHEVQRIIDAQQPAYEHLRKQVGEALAQIPAK